MHFLCPPTLRSGSKIKVIIKKKLFACLYRNLWSAQGNIIKPEWHLHTTRRRVAWSFHHFSCKVKAKMYTRSLLVWTTAIDWCIICQRLYIGLFVVVLFLLLRPGHVCCPVRRALNRTYSSWDGFDTPQTTLLKENVLHIFLNKFKARATTLQASDSCANRHLEDSLKNPIWQPVTLESTVRPDPWLSISYCTLKSNTVIFTCLLGLTRSFCEIWCAAQIFGTAPTAWGDKDHLEPKTLHPLSSTCSGVRSRGQHLEQGGISFHNHLLQPFWEDSNLFPDQLGDGLSSVFWVFLRISSYLDMSRKPP